MTLIRKNDTISVEEKVIVIKMQGGKIMYRKGSKHQSSYADKHPKCSPGETLHTKAKNLVLLH